MVFALKRGKMARSFGRVRLWPCGPVACVARVARVAQAKRRPVQYAGKEWSGPECCSEMLRKTAFQASSNLKQAGAGGCFQVFLNFAYFPSYRYLPKYTIQVSYSIVLASVVQPPGRKYSR